MAETLPSSAAPPPGPVALHAGVIVRSVFLCALHHVAETLASSAAPPPGPVALHAAGIVKCGGRAYVRSMHHAVPGRGISAG